MRDPAAPSSSDAGGRQSAPEDHLLMVSIRHGDADAFGELVERHFSVLARVAGAITGSPDIAHDVVQDVFMDLWTRASTLDIHRDVRGYLWAATRNRARMVLRHARIESRYQEAVHDSQAYMPNVAYNAAENNLESEEILYQIHTGLATLPVRCREIFLLRWREGLTPEEIAHALDISLATVRNQISRAVRGLAEYFGVR